MTDVEVGRGSRRGGLAADSVTVSYAGEAALVGASLTLEAGEFVVATGPSGCGKSTLALALAGLIPRVIPARIEGSITLDGLDATTLPLHELTSRVGIVFQNPAAQLFNNTVAEEVAFGPRNLGLPAAEIARRVAWAVQSTGISHLGDRAVRHLSGGEQQRVAIASVLAMRPGILLLDEPTANLDRNGTEGITRTLAHLNQEEGITILLIEHRLHPFIDLARRALLLANGKLVADGATATVLGQESVLRRWGIRDPWRPIGPRCDLLPPQGIESSPAGRHPLVELRGVCAAYGRRHVLHDLDLALYPGEFVALVGDNGAGKSTLARLLAGILRPARGKVAWDAALGRRDGARRTGLLFQNARTQLLCDTVREEVTYAPRNFGLPLPESVDRALAATDLASLAGRHPMALSMGQAQRAALAALLSASPRLLVLDEPTVGQDWGHLAQLIDTLLALQRQGHTILLITHDEKLVYHCSQRIVIMDGGRIIADGPPRTREA